jgi:hypothetical protein
MNGLVQVRAASERFARLTVVPRYVAKHRRNQHSRDLVAEMLVGDEYELLADPMLHQSARSHGTRIAYSEPPGEPFRADAGAESAVGGIRGGWRSESEAAG